MRRERRLAVTGCCLILFLSSFAVPGMAENKDQPPRSTGDVVISNCFAMLLEQAEVPAQEAGVLAEIKVKEGDSVRAGQLLAKIDDRRAEIDKRLATFEYQAAREKADNDINVRYSKAAADVAEAEYQASLDANKRVPNSVAQADVRKRQLEHRRAVLQIEQSSLEQSVARQDALAIFTKVEAADDNIRRRRINSPIDGVVVDVRRHLGEWVQPGEVVAHVVRFDRLRVEGFVKGAEHHPSRISGRDVRIQFEVAGGERKELPGKVVFVNLLLQTAGDYRVLAEVENRQEDGQWLLQPGKPVTMVVE